MVNLVKEKTIAVPRPSATTEGSESAENNSEAQQKSAETTESTEPASGST